jgi:hypothetical protein
VASRARGTAVQRLCTLYLRVSLERFAQKQEARGMVGDGERVTIPSVAEPELTFEIGAPQIVTDGALR